MSSDLPADFESVAVRMHALRAAPELAGGDDPVRCAAVLGWSLHEWKVLSSLHDAQPCPLGMSLTSPLADWFACSPGPAAQALTRALAFHLQQDRVEAAAPLALTFGTAAQRLDLLRRAGWRLLWRPQRRVLGPLLDSVAMQQGVEDVLPLQMAWWIEVERVPHAAERRLQRGSPLSAPVEALVRARLAQVLNLARGAMKFAEAAMAGFAADLQPLALWARLALGLALLDAARPREALASLSALVRACGRDDLPMLALDAMSVQARAHDELADDSALRITLKAARALAQGRGIVDAPSLQALERQRRQLRLRAAAFAPGAPAESNSSSAAVRAPASDEPLAPPLPAAHGDAVPGLIIDAQAALHHNDHGRAAALLAEVDRRLVYAFDCHKWQQGERMARLWWLARRPDAEALSAARELETPPDARATLVEWHAAVLAAAAGVLADAPLPPEQLQDWDELLTQRGLTRLRARLTLLRALGPPANAEWLLNWLQSTPSPALLLDAQWLAPKLVAELQALLSWPPLVRHPAERGLARRLLRHMLAALPKPAADVDDLSQSLATLPPLADLTPRR